MKNLNVVAMTAYFYFNKTGICKSFVNLNVSL